jgi:Uncharacterised nucleotidyltransferase
MGLDMVPMTMDEVARAAGSSRARYLHLLAQILLNDAGSSVPAPGHELQTLSRWDHDELARFLAFADLHHVLVRALEALRSATIIETVSPHLANPRLANECAAALAKEQARISQALNVLETVCDALESAECSAIVIKSLDHWPDIGSDLDLYTGGRQEQVINILKGKFGAEVLPRSWGDRLAHKWNFRLPDLPEAVEVHVGCLGQTGEHLTLARRVENRAVRRTVGGHSFRVPAPEERVLITTLQRMYRHFYCRLCDIVDTTKLIQAQELDCTILRAGAESSGIWPGVAAFLMAVAEYARAYGVELELPSEVISSATQGDALQLRGDFLRISIVPQAAGLFLRQVVYAGKQKNLRTVSRLSLLPGLAAAAFVAYKITGNDKGIW